MSGEISGTGGTSPSQPSPIVKADAQTAGLAATSNKNVGKTNASTKLSSVSDLKDKAPEVYRAMMEGIAMNIISNMRAREEQRKKMASEYNR